MIRVFCFVAGETPSPFGTLWSAWAITETGKWIAGAISQKGARVALERCIRMATEKAKTMLSAPAETVPAVLTDDEVLKAMRLAFAKMP